MARRTAARAPRRAKESSHRNLQQLVQDSLAPIALFGVVATAVTGAVTNWETIQKHYDERPLLVGFVVAVAVSGGLDAH
jgi:hypothetical protein